MLEAKEFSMHDGYTVPIYGYDGYQACVTMGGLPHDVSERELSCAAPVFGLRVLFRTGAHCSRGQQAGGTAFSNCPREAEVLKWTAEGRTAWEVSAILNISENTVETHLRAATRKMNVASKVHAVALAIRHGVISYRPRGSQYIGTQVTVRFATMSWSAALACGPHHLGSEVNHRMPVIITTEAYHGRLENIEPMGLAIQPTIRFLIDGSRTSGLGSVRPRSTLAKFCFGQAACQRLLSPIR